MSDSETDSTDLLTCPFCGGDAREEEWDVTSGSFHHVTCTGCGATSGRFSDPIGAVSAWNLRHKNAESNGSSVASDGSNN